MQLNRRGMIFNFVLVALVSGFTLTALPFRVADTLPSSISDDSFWRMVSDFSEEGGAFRFEYMSNEFEFQSVIPRLKETTKPGGVYLGVGPEQNFTYIAAVRPKIAFIFDIRRQNMIEHLVYKAIFELSSDRADFLSLLFSRRRPASLSDKSSVEQLFQLYRALEPDGELYGRNLQAIKDRLLKDHRIQLTSEDLTGLEYIYRTLVDAGPGPNYPAGGFGGFRGPTYADLMTATDDQGETRSYLATQENFQFIQEMEKKNLIVPLVGDFAGKKAIRTVAQYLKDHDVMVAAFYTSNVEQYLFQQPDDWTSFYSNVATLPVDSSSTFIRSSHFSYGIPQTRARRVTRGTFLSLLCSITDLINAFNEGRIQNYDQVIQMSR
jgi:hypothetical protein